MMVSQSIIRTAAKAVVIRNNHLLTVVKRDQYGLFYILPGGGQMCGETLDIALQRECQEEIGVQVQVENLLFVREYIGKDVSSTTNTKDIHIVDFLFSCRIPDDYEPHMGPKPDNDQESVTWLPLTKLEQYRFFPSILKQILLERQNIVYVGNV